MILNLYNPRVHFFHIILFLSSFLSVFAADSNPVDTFLGQSSFTVRAIVGVAFILVGLFLVLSGESFFKIILFIAGAVLFGVISYVLARVILGDLNLVSDSKRITVYVVSAVIGLIGGFTALCCYQIGLLVLGGLLGFALANIIIRTNVVTGQTGQIVLIAVLVIVFALLTFFLSKFIITIASAFVGATITMTGIDMFALTGFNNYIFSLKINGDIIPTTPKLWAMVCSLFVLAAFGILVQFFVKRRK